MSRDLQHRLRTRIDLVAQYHGLPLAADHVERLAIELTPVVKAMLAEQAEDHAATAPVPFAVVSEETVEEAGVATTRYAGCTVRIGTEIDFESPAALLAARLRMRQPDVVATDIPAPAYLGLTVRPQSLHAWRWWLDKLGIAAEDVTIRADVAYAMGVVDDVAVQLCGDGVPALLTDKSAARLMGLLSEASP